MRPALGVLAVLGTFAAVGFLLGLALRVALGI